MVEPPCYVLINIFMHRLEFYEYEQSITRCKFHCYSSIMKKAKCLLVSAASQKLEAKTNNPIVLS